MCWPVKSRYQRTCMGTPSPSSPFLLLPRESLCLKCLFWGWGFNCSWRKGCISLNSIETELFVLYLKSCLMRWMDLFCSPTSRDWQSVTFQYWNLGSSPIYSSYNWIWQGRSVILSDFKKQSFPYLPFPRGL